ncbi:hypothetical protein [Nonomuraea sp. CA-141351]|uniref:hypothetical protein n=1 Tax=Nonomuraea sp. CA-141351 TaxID=3239996 RepID=UPI003D90EAE6
MLKLSDIRACGRCGADVRWTTTMAGARLLVDAEPNPDGNTAVWTEATGTVRSRRISAEMPARPWERVMMPHVATCQGAARQEPLPIPTPHPAPIPDPPNVIRLDRYRGRRKT